MLNNCICILAMWLLVSVMSLSFYVFIISMILNRTGHMSECMHTSVYTCSQSICSFGWQNMYPSLPYFIIKDCAGVHNEN